MPPFHLIPLENVVIMSKQELIYVFLVHETWGCCSFRGPRDVLRSQDWYIALLSHGTHCTEAWHGTRERRLWPHCSGHLYRIKFSLREWQFHVLLAQPRVTSLLENQLQSWAKEQGRRAIVAGAASKNTKGNKGRGRFLSA